MVHLVLLRSGVTAGIVRCGVARVAAVGGVVLLARLRANASKASKARTALARIVVMVVVVIGVTDGAATLVDVLVWTQMVIVG